MDNELREYLVAMEGRLDAKYVQLDTRINALDVKLERVETTLLTQFHKWASPKESKLRTHASALRTLDLEIEALADRVTKREEARA